MSTLLDILSMDYGLSWIDETIGGPYFKGRVSLECLWLMFEEGGIIID